MLPGFRAQRRCTCDDLGVFLVFEAAGWSSMIARAVENTIYFATVNYALQYQEMATSRVAPDGTCVGYTAYGEEALLVVASRN
jgi:hypothetical protein